MTTVDVASLALGKVLGEGGQGVVYELPNQPAQVYKRYHDPDSSSFTPETLRRLVAERDSIRYSGRHVDEFAAWPNAVVVDGSKTIGLLMPRAPAEFTLQFEQTTKFADLSYIATDPKEIWGDIKLPNLAQRLQILNHLAGAMDALHSRRIVLGDLSFMNVLWSCTPKARIMLIDCDGMRREGERPVLPQADTPDWRDPHARSGSAPDRDRDRYKLSLAVLRVLSRRLNAQHGDDETLPPDLDPSIRDQCTQLLKEAAGGVGTRPSAKRWADALSGRAFKPTPPAGSRLRQPDAPPPQPEKLVQKKPPRQFRPVTPPGGG